MVIKESLNIPCEGIFWIIDNKLISFCDQVNPRDPYQMTNLLHKEVWLDIKDKYLVSGKEVSYDYFPRGRVETLVIINPDETISYCADIYMDRCISRKEFENKIIDDFRLYLSNVEVNFCGQLFIDGSHYTCHNCRR